jgi:uncharacterized protein YifE (UPF0438 family)
MELEKLELWKFRPRRAVSVLAERPEHNEAAFVHTWALAQVLAWAILDQRPGKRPSKGANLGSDKPKKRKIRTGNAKQAGQITLAYLLDRHLRRGQPRSEEYVEKLRLMIVVFMECGGFASSFKGPGAEDLFDDVKDANRELGYVYRIVDFMCRYGQRPEGTENDPNFTIESAKSFVEFCAHEDEATYGLSKIGKIWEKYKNAAPYIFAVHTFSSFRPEKAKSVDEIIDWLERFTSKQKRLMRFLARAAYASDLLRGKARNVRKSDFKDIERVAPPIRPFTGTELDIISSIDRQAPIA